MLYFEMIYFKCIFDKMKTLKQYINNLLCLPQKNVIYTLSDPITGKTRYVGKAKELSKRIRNHYKPSNLKQKTHKNNWLVFLLKNNLRVVVSIIEICEDDNRLNECEKKWISYFKSIGYDLTNGTDGGDGGKMSDESIKKMIKKKTGKKMSEETKLKISKAHKGHKPYRPNYKHSEETKVKIGKSNKGKYVSEETRKKLSIINKGRKFSEETIKRMSKAQLGKKRSEEQKKKISDRMKGNKYSLGRKSSEETKNKISKAHLGKKKKKRGYKLSEERKKKYSKLYSGKTWKIINGKRVWIDKL